MPWKGPSRRVRYDRAHLIPEAFFVEMCAVFSLKRLDTLLESSCPIVFELLLDVTERSLNLREAELPWKELSQHEPETFYHWAITSDRIGAHTDTDHAVPYGTGIWVASAASSRCDSDIECERWLRGIPNVP